MKKLITKNSKSEIVKFIDGWCWNQDLKEIISIPNHLKELSFWENNIKILPKLPNSLEILWGDDNQLIILPEVLPKNLKKLHLTNNKLTSLPKNLPQSLEELSCEKNSIKQLPNLRELKRLKFIICDIQCFETYMLEMENIDFDFHC